MKTIVFLLLLVPGIAFGDVGWVNGRRIKIVGSKEFVQAVKGIYDTTMALPKRYSPTMKSTVSWRAIVTYPHIKKIQGFSLNDEYDIGCTGYFIASTPNTIYVLQTEDEATLAEVIVHESIHLMMYNIDHYKHFNMDAREYIATFMGYEFLSDYMGY